MAFVNLKDFPSAALSPYGIEAQHPDDFLFDLLDLDESALVSAVRAQHASLKNPPRTMTELLDILHAQGLAETVMRLRAPLAP